MELEGDTFFPEMDLTGWRMVRAEGYPADVENEYAFVFRMFERPRTEEEEEE